MLRRTEGNTGLYVWEPEQEEPMGHGPISYTADDFGTSPFVVFYETTRACDLVCHHCRACAQPHPHPRQLRTEQSCLLLDQLASFPKPPIVIFTGGDPMKRPDIFDLVRYARDIRLEVAMTPSATPLVTHEALRKLADAGIGRLAMSIDGVDAATHDAFRGTPGSFDRTFEILRDAKECGLDIQVNTTVVRSNVDQIDAIADMLAGLGITLWSVFFLVPVGRGLFEQRIPAARYEDVFERLWTHARTQPYGIKTTEAHHYRRFVLQRMGDPQRQPAGGHPSQIQRAPLGVNDGKGCVFISHTGTVFPSGFMPLTAGHFPDENIVSIYQNSPLLQSLRNPDGFKGKCGQCEYRTICGGSRARAYAVTRDPLQSEPDCIYMPKSLRESAACSA